MSLSTRVDTLVANLKNWTRNNDQVTQSGKRQPGVNESLLLFYLNEGKDHIQRAVSNAQRTAFASYSVKQITSELIEFPIPEEAIMQNRVIRLEYGTANANSKFSRLKAANVEQWVYRLGPPVEYHIQGYNIVPAPVPDSGYYRFLIQRKDDTLDVRRGKIAAAGINSGGGNLISITLENTVDDPNATALGSADYVCFCDRDGVVKLYNVPISSYNASTFLLTVDGAFAYNNELTVGNYVTVGKNTSTHSKLSVDFEKYIMEWAKYSLLLWDSNDAAVQEIPKMQSMRQDLLENMSDIADMEEVARYGDLTGDWPA